MEHQEQKEASQQQESQSRVSYQNADAERLFIKININGNNFQFFKMDILFYNSLKKLIKSYKKAAIFHLLKALVLAIFIPIDYLILKGPKDELILVAMIAASITSLIQGFINLKFMRNISKNTMAALILAQKINHTTEQPALNPFSLQDSVSQTMYNKPNQTLITNEGLEEKTKLMYESVLQGQIKQIFRSVYDGLSSIRKLGHSLGFFAMIFAICALSMKQYSSGQIAVLIMFIVLEAFSKITAIAVFIVLALSPLLCILFCCCACCCGSAAQESPQLPAPVKATQMDITQAQGKCTICYQDFKVGNNIIKLRCSPNHAFHPICISGWTKIKANCPICRAQIGGNGNPNNIPINQNRQN